jgi:catalase
VDAAALLPLRERLASEGAVPRIVGPRMGNVEASDRSKVEVDVSLEAAPSVLFDAMVLPGGADAVAALLANGLALDFVKEQYRHCKPMLVFKDAEPVLAKIGVPALSDRGGPEGIILATRHGAGAGKAFIEAISRHRAFSRDRDPPTV